MKPSLAFLSLFCLLFWVSCKEKPTEQAADDSPAQSTYLPLGTMCGTVQFSDGCGTATDSLIQFGLALTHHMTYEDAAYTFDQVLQKDPDCFWGHWGKAMTYIHPLWPDEPGPEELKSGWEHAKKARETAKNERESLYAEALAAYYEEGASRTEKERLTAFEAGWGRLHKAYPLDLEADLFHALFRLSIVSPADKSYTVQKEVGKRAEMALQVIPDHPGGFHYAIHAYDVPSLASNALRVARNYGQIAPEIPHALHMPSHIFTRLGYWEESIDWNSRSAEAALLHPYDGQVSGHYFHALDYLAYAYLQQAQDEQANKISAILDTLQGPYHTHAATGYMLAAVPARLALERRQWDKAAQLSVRQPDHFPWEKFPAFEALTHFAKGIGAARASMPEAAEESLAQLDRLKSILDQNPSGTYWAGQVDIQRTAVKAWQYDAQGQEEKALETLWKAAEMEANTEKSPITPGELLPVKEMLGDMLLDKGMYEKSLAAYEDALTRNPNRYNSLYGAAYAAEKMGNRPIAQQYYQKLLELTDDSESNREGIQHAQDYLHAPTAMSMK